MLQVRTWGCDDSPEEVRRYGMAVADAVVRHGCTRVLCDETGLEYRLGTIDIHQAASFLASYVRASGKVAVVCQERFIRDAHFWEDVAANRGMSVRAFTKLEAARKWLDGA